MESTEFHSAVLYVLSCVGRDDLTLSCSQLCKPMQFIHMILDNYFLLILVVKFYTN